MKSILVVDDSRVSRKILVNMLEVTGYTVAGEAIDGREGFEFYKKSPEPEGSRGFSFYLLFI